jgi:hypothetical protein
VLRADFGPPAGVREVRRAEAVAGQAQAYSQLGLAHAAGARQRRRGTGHDAGRTALLGRGLHGQDGKIVEIDFLADPARLRELDLTILDS